MKTINQIIILVVMMCLGTSPNLLAQTKSSATIAGTVSHIVKEGNRYKGKVTFTGADQKGNSFNGTGTTEFQLAKDKTLVTGMTIKFKGSRKDKQIQGSLKTKKGFQISVPEGDSFGFSNVVVGEELTEI